MKQTNRHIPSTSEHISWVPKECLFVPLHHIKDYFSADVDLLVQLRITDTITFQSNNFVLTVFLVMLNYNVEFPTDLL